MKVRLAPSIKQPVLNSYFVSEFSPETLELLNRCKPFTTYHKQLKEYEITPDVLARIGETKEIFVTPKVYPRFERSHTEKYGYQEDAVEFARKTDNVFLNFTQGMGKSLTTMKIIDDRKFVRTLIICGQSNLQEEWIKDAIKHRYQDAKFSMRIVGDDTGAGNAKKASWLKETNGDSIVVDLINIEALRAESVVQALNAKCYNCIVVDEIQSAKGWKSQQTEGLHELTRWQGQYRIALSGTPVLNDPLEFFSMLKYFGMLKDTARTTFERYYGEYGFDFWGHYVCKGYRNLDQLAELVKPIICWADKAELGLPPKRRKLIELEWKDNQEYLRLEKIYKMTTARLKKAGYQTKPQVRALMQNLSSMADEKIEFVLRHSETNKLLVFSQYTTVLEQYREKLAEQGRKVLYYHGGLSLKDRLAVLEEWRKGAHDILLLSVMSARYGINLTEANEVVFIDMPSSLSVLEQAEDRSHRIGQSLPVTSYLLCSSGIDRDALDNIERKQESLDRLSEKLTPLV